MINTPAGDTKYKTAISKPNRANIKVIPPTTVKNRTRMHFTASLERYRINCRNDFYGILKSILSLESLISYISSASMLVLRHGSFWNSYPQV